MTNKTIILLTIFDFVSTFLILNGFFQYEYLVETVAVAAVSSVFVLVVLIATRNWKREQKENFE